MRQQVKKHANHVLTWLLSFLSAAASLLLIMWLESSAN